MNLILNRWNILGNNLKLSGFLLSCLESNITIKLILALNLNIMIFSLRDIILI
jgi:hypothetical protein